MKKSWFFVLLIMYAKVGAGQAYDRTWLVGLPMSVLRFNGSSLDTGSLNGGMQNVGAIEALSDVSDTNGNLLFYSNGGQIGDSAANIMENGDTLMDSLIYLSFQGIFSEPQTNIILPRSGNTFYLFYYSESDSLYGSGTIDEPDRLYYAVIDMDQNGGLGKVISKKNVAYKGLFGDRRLTACRHANGRDWWLVHQGFENDEYFIYRVTPDSVYPPHIQHIGPSSFVGDDDGGQSAFSPDGSKFVTCCLWGPVCIMDFDRCTGTFSHPDSFDMVQDTFSYNHNLFAPGSAGCCFSPNGRFVYFSNTFEIWQYDTWASSIDSSATMVGRWDSVGSVGGFLSFYLMQLMPNGQIIIDDYQGGGTAFHIIDSPDVKGLGCHFVFGGLPTSTSNADVLPNMINYRLGALPGVNCDSILGINPTLPSPEMGGMKIFPSPSADFVTVSLVQHHKDARLHIYDMLGHEVYRNESMYLDATIDVRSFSSGIYFVKILSPDGDESGRFVKE